MLQILSINVISFFYFIDRLMEKKDPCNSAAIGGAKVSQNNDNYRRRERMMICLFKIESSSISYFRYSAIRQAVNAFHLPSLNQ